MKLSINCRPVDGPWGGGNRFVKSLAAAMKERGDSVVFDLADDDIDIVLIVDPRARNPQLVYTPAHALDYVAARRAHTVIVHRINECDERKGTRTMNLRLRIANYCADHTVFVASWLKDLDLWRRESSASVILGGADPAVFARGTAMQWDSSTPFRLVTHHWGAHRNKGLDIYDLVDRMRQTNPWRDRIAFMHIGNKPAGAQMPNIDWRPPLDGLPLARMVASNHGYLTASVGEPSGNHHMEGAMVGLPILYRRSGGLPEYCAPYGVGFDGPADFPQALERFLATYPQIKPKLAEYPYTSARMIDEFLGLFDVLVADGKKIAARRRPWRDPIVRLLGRLPV